jgi:hypothetical protein
MVRTSLSTNYESRPLNRDQVILVYSREYAYPIHQECTYFKNGFCTLSGVNVDQNGSACPSFSPKRNTKKFLAEENYPEVWRSYSMYPPQIWLGLPKRKGNVRLKIIRNSIGRNRIRNRKVRTQWKKSVRKQFRDLEKQLKDIKHRLDKI